MRSSAFLIRSLMRKISTFSVTKSTQTTEVYPFMSALIIFCCLRFCSRSSFSCSSFVICAFTFSTRYRTRRSGFSSPMRTNIALLQPWIFPWKISEITFVFFRRSGNVERVVKFLIVLTLSGHARFSMILVRLSCRVLPHFINLSMNSLVLIGNAVLSTRSSTCIEIYSSVVA